MATTYHDASEADHRATATALGSTHFPAAVSVFGELPNQRYAATWVAGENSTWRSCWEPNLGQFKTWCDAARKDKMRVVHVNALGPRATAIFAAVAVPDTAELDWDVETDLTEEALSERAIWARKEGRILRSATIYGNASDRRFAAIWEENTDRVAWNYGVHTGAQFAQAFRAFTDQLARPVIVDQVAGRYLSVWHDFYDPRWAFFPRLTSKEYEQKVAALPAGERPLCVQGNDDPTNRRWAAILGRPSKPPKRVWSVNGVIAPGLATFDDTMKAVMQSQDVSAPRAGMLAVAKDGRLLLARGYTWAEPGYRVTQATDVFRIGSCSKMMTSLAVMQLIEEGLLNPGETVQSILKVKPYGGKFGDGFGKITVGHLLAYASGLGNQGIDDRELVAAVAKDYGITLNLPITNQELLRWRAARNAKYTPGTNTKYENLGYNVLGQIIETKRGTGLMTALDAHVFNPVGVTRARLRALTAATLGDEVHPHHPVLTVEPSITDNDGPLVARLFNGNGRWLAEGQLAMAACDIVRVLSAFDLGEANPLLSPTMATIMWSKSPYPNSEVAVGGWALDAGLEGGVTRWSKGGEVGGGRSKIVHRSDGFSIAVAINANTAGVGAGVWDGVIAKVKSWPEEDLFPQVGLPSLV